MSSFDAAIGIIIEHEGGLTDDQHDKGGITNYGITLPILREMGMAGDLDHDGDIDPEDIRGMTLEEAKEIYRARWWDRFGYGRIESQPVATKLLDECVNFGWRQGHIVLQRAVNTVLEYSAIRIDGDLGPMSMTAVSGLTKDGRVPDLINAMRCGMGYVYGQIITKDPSQKCFELGWLKRAAW